MRTPSHLITLSRCLRCLGLFVFWLLAAELARAGEADRRVENAVAPAPAPLGWMVYAGYESMYLYRGVDYGDHLWEVGAVIPIKLSDHWTFTFAPWYGELAGGEYDELDLVGTLSWKTHVGTFSLGLAWYEFPEKNWDTLEPNFAFETEIAKVASMPVMWNVSTSVDVNADGGGYTPPHDGDPGWYFETALSVPVKVTDKLTLVPELSCSYGDGYYGVSGWNTFGAKLTARYALAAGVSVEPFIAASFALDSLRQVGEHDHLAGGVMINVTF